MLVVWWCGGSPLHYSQFMCPTYSRWAVPLMASAQGEFGSCSVSHWVKYDLQSETRVDIRLKQSWPGTSERNPMNWGWFLVKHTFSIGPIPRYLWYHSQRVNAAISKTYICYEWVCSTDTSGSLLIPNPPFYTLSILLNTDKTGLTALRDKHIAWKFELSTLSQSCIRLLIEATLSTFGKQRMGWALGNRHWTTNLHTAVPLSINVSFTR